MMPQPQRIALLPAVLLWLLAVGCSAVEAQAPPSLTVSDVRAEEPPAVTAYLLLSRPGSFEPIAGLTGEDFEVSVDGQVAEGVTLRNQLASGEGAAFVFLVDRGDERRAVEAYRGAVIQFVRALGPQDQVAVLAYADEVTLVSAFSGNAETLAAAAEGIEAGGKACTLHDVVVRAASLVEASEATLPARRVGILLCSRGDEGSVSTAEEARDRAREVGLALVTAGLHGGGDAGAAAVRDRLQWLAVNTGGLAVFFEGPSALDEGLGQLPPFFQNQPVLEVEDASYRGDGKEHRLRVRLSTEEGAVLKDRAFRAPKVSFSRLQIVLLVALVVAAVFSLIFLFKARSPRVPLFGRLVPVGGGRKQKLRGLVKIGSGEGNQIIIRDKRISRQHACIELHQDGPWVTDMNSLNGTTVNGQAVQSHRLQDGDLVGFGKVLEFRFEAPDASSSLRLPKKKKSKKKAPAPGPDTAKTMVQSGAAAEGPAPSAGKTMVQPGSEGGESPGAGKTMVQPGSAADPSPGAGKTMVQPGSSGGASPDAGKTMVKPSAGDAGRGDEAGKAQVRPEPPDDPGKTVVRRRPPDADDASS
jgi:hypothetical protein